MYSCPANYHSLDKYKQQCDSSINDIRDISSANEKEMETSSEQSAESMQTTHCKT